MRGGKRGHRHSNRTAAAKRYRGDGLGQGTALNKINTSAFWIDVDERETAQYEDRLRALANAEARLAAADRAVENYERRLAKSAAKVKAEAERRQLAVEQEAKLRRLQAEAEKRRRELAQIQALMTAPNAPTDKQIRLRTGRDDHLELGVPKLAKPKLMPVFPVETIQPQVSQIGTPEPEDLEGEDVNTVVPIQPELSQPVDVSITRADDGTLRVDSLTIAQGSGVEHRAVLQLIDGNQSDLEEFGPLAFEMRKGQPLPQGGYAKATRIALLNEQQATLVMTYQRNTEQVRTFKKALVKAFFEMAKQITIPQRELTREEILSRGLLEAQSVMEEQKRQIEASQAKIEADAPKVNYIDTYVSPRDDLLRFSIVASNNGIKESQLRRLLENRGWIYSQSYTRWSPSKRREITVYRYSEKAPYKRYFRRVVNHEALPFRGEAMHTLKITPQGAEAITRLIEKYRGRLDSLPSKSKPVSPWEDPDSEWSD